jgi:hypothetical protein
MIVFSRKDYIHYVNNPPGGQSVVKLQFILSVIIGLAVFLTDLLFGWLTYLCSPIPVIFIIAIIIGLVAGTHGGAVTATMITWIGGLLIGVLIAPIIIPTMNPDQSLLGLFLIMFFYSLRGFYSFQVEGNIVEVIVTGLLYFVVMLIVTPIVYLVSFAFAPVGVVIGNFIRKAAYGRSVKQRSIAQETPVIKSRPVEEEPAEADASVQPKEEFSDSAEN